MPSRRIQRLLLATAAIAFVIAGAFLWRSNAGPKNTVRQILLANSTTEEQLAELQPYVQLDDSITTVAAALDLQQNQFSQPPLPRPAHHSIGLGGVHLELALRTDGTVGGIGRYVQDSQSGGTVWLAGHGDKWWEPTIQP